MKYLFISLLFLAASGAYAGTGMPSIDKSGTIVTGGTFQSITNQTTPRSSLDFQNICGVSGSCTATTDVCYLHFGSDTATTANSLVLTAGQEYLRSSGSVPNDTIQVTCTSTGDKFYLKLQ